MLTRRQAIKRAALAAGAVSAGAGVLPLSAQPPFPRTGPYALPMLPYPHSALEPHIDTLTMNIHHGHHHAAYVFNLNTALANYPLLGQRPIEDLLRDLDSIPAPIREAVRNQGGGHANHSMFWLMMKPGGGGQPTGKIAEAFEKNFGSFAGFQQRFTDAALKLFGSGWVWLVLDDKKELALMPLPNQDSPFSRGLMPLLGIDVWEHAYYLKHQNVRADYVSAFFNVINWDYVSEIHAKHTAA